MQIDKIKNIFLKTILSILFVFVIYVTYCAIFKVYGSREILKPFVIMTGILVCIYFFIRTGKFFDKIDETEPGVGGEIQLTDALSKLDSIVSIFFSILLYFAVIVFISLFTLKNNFDIPFLSTIALSKLLICPTRFASKSPTSPKFFVLTSSKIESENAEILFCAADPNSNICVESNTSITSE